MVVHGWFKGGVGGRMVTINKGEECLIPKGTPHKHTNYKGDTGKIVENRDDIETAHFRVGSM